VISLRALLLLVALAAIAAACAGGSVPAAPAQPSPTSAELGRDPLPLGTPGSPDPSHLAAPDGAIRFEQSVLTWEGIDAPTTLAFGPDGRLYVGQLDGQVVALRLDGQALVDAEVIAPADALGDVLGIAFNPAGPTQPVTLYVSHTQLYAGEDGPPFAGKVSKLVAPDFTPVDVVTGLPVSAAEHGTNAIAFDAAGRLYIAQGGTTNAGVPSERHSRPETPLSGAILLADLRDPAFDGAIMYDTLERATHEAGLVSGDVRVFASGFRNPYDLVVHSNGLIYATDNGPNAPDGPRSTGCATEDDGPHGPDELNLIIEGRYYGHPNRNRGRIDERQCVYRAPDDASGESTPPIATLSYFASADGIAEYTSDAFGGRMRGDLVYVEWARGRVWRVVLSGDGLAVESISQLLPEPLERPLDVAVGPDGALYIAEMGADRIAVFTPEP
jgi:glucose/arabinose dehydrogenase